MSKAREQIFQRLQRLTRQPARDNHPSSLVEKRLATFERSLLPVLTQAVKERFISKLTAASATITSITDMAQLPDAVSEYLSSAQLQRKLVVSAAQDLKQLSWPNDYEIEYRAAIASDVTALSMAYAGIAETGSLVLCSGQDTPTTLNFLPDNYICMLRSDDIYPYMEDIWALLRKEENGLPRALNFITGPSRTADVEQTIQLGAHGPRRMHVILIEPAQ